MRTLGIISILLLYSCAPNNVLGTSAAAQNNVYKMQDLQVGMSSQDVFQIMRFPDKEEQIVTDDGCYDIWYYVTNPTVLSQPTYVRDNLTPLVFKDGIYVGKGYHYYSKVVQKAQAKPIVPPPEQNNDLEKTLQDVTKPTAAPQKGNSQIPAGKTAPVQPQGTNTPPPQEKTVPKGQPTNSQKAMEQAVSAQEPVNQEDSDLENVLNAPAAAPEKGNSQEPSQKQKKKQTSPQPQGAKPAPKQGKTPPTQGRQPSPTPTSGEPSKPTSGQPSKSSSQPNGQPSKNPQKGPLQSTPQFEPEPAQPQQQQLEQKSVSAAAAAKKPSPSSKEDDEEKKTPPKKTHSPNKEDQEMLDEGEDQDFNYW